MRRFALKRDTSQGPSEVLYPLTQGNTSQKEVEMRRTSKEWTGCRCVPHSSQLQHSYCLTWPQLHSSDCMDFNISKICIMTHHLALIYQLLITSAWKQNTWQVCSASKKDRPFQTDSGVLRSGACLGGGGIGPCLPPLSGVQILHYI